MDDAKVVDLIEAVMEAEGEWQTAQYTVKAAEGRVEIARKALEDELAKSPVGLVDTVLRVAKETMERAR